jgi:hypothetical protein
MERKDEVIMCACNTPNHNIIIRNDNEDVYIYVSLNNFRFFTRLWLGLKYIFNFNISYGHYDEIILEKSDNTINKLKEIITILEKKVN